MDHIQNIKTVFDILDQTEGLGEEECDKLKKSLSGLAAQLVEEDNHDSWKSDKIDKLAGALAKAQGEMGGVKKTSTNPFYKSKYADINDCLEAAIPALSSNGLAITQGNEFNGTDGYYITTMLYP